MRSATGIHNLPESEHAETAPPAAIGGTARSPLWRALLLITLFGIALVTVLALIGDARELGHAFRHFNWWLMIPMLVLTVWNYGGRFVKWQMYVRALGIELPAGLSARIFLSGFAMSLTPGKVGELVKAIYVRRATGAPVNRTSAVVAAERITDALAMLILAAIGAAEYAYGRPLLAVVAGLGVAGILLLQRPDLLMRQIERATDLPLLGRVAAHAQAFVDASGTLFRPGMLLRAVGLGVISWTGECVAFFLVLIGLGVDPSPRLLLIATFILAVSSLAGGASMLPGGLGVADAGIAGLLVLTLNDEGMSHTTAAAATILIRFATLWFAVILGALVLANLERRWLRAEGSDQPVQSAPQTVVEARGRDDAPAGFEAIGDGGNL
ncbi:MAG: glycosyltransferase 2 family protein [Thermomicrobiales bacterium]|nr:glycosyltransferase 2 family protein [Thermomicrobiales bacterium]